MLHLRTALYLVTFAGWSKITLSSADNAPCVDSPFHLKWDDPLPRRRRCEWVVNNVGCDNSVVATHCPLSCDMCFDHRCSDSLAVVYFEFALNDCAWFAELSSDIIDFYCQDVGLQQTCRETCNYCGNDVPTISPTVPLTMSPSGVDSMSPSPSTSSSSLPTGSPVAPASNFNFDEAGLDDGDPWHDYDYGYYNYAELTYTHPDILFINIGWYQSSLSPGTGYEYGNETPENVAFNMYGDPASIICAGGSFTVESMYVNNAWIPNSIVNFIGNKNNGDEVQLGVDLGPIANNTFLSAVDFHEFTDLSSLTFEITNGNDIAVFDDMMLEIETPCVVPIVDTESYTTWRDFSPIYPA